MRPSSRGLSALLLALLPTLGITALGGPADAQPWRGKGGVQGVVLDEDGEPIAGARVTLRREAGSEAGPAPATTDEKGRWSIIGLAGGRWSLTIEAEDYQTVEGWAQVADEGPSPGVRVEMIPLSVVTPAFSEGNPRTVINWLERGNSLLEQGRYEEARAEYEKALQVLPPEQQGEVYRSVARTYYLEGKREVAVETLKKALVSTPEDEVSRQLFLLLLEGMGRKREGQRWLERLGTEGREALAAELGMGAGDDGTGLPVLEPPEPEAPRAHREGAYTTAFSRRSPLSRLEVIAPRYTLEVEEIVAADPAGAGYAVEEESFDVFVPESYDAEVPAPLLVWVSPVSRGGLRSPDLQEVMDERGMLWIGANRSGNSRSKWVRLGLALDAAHNMQRFYSIDPRRIYVAGYSGGGRTASALAALFPEVFHGLLAIMGVDFYDKVAIPHRPGAHWVPAFPPPPPATLRSLQQDSRYVLVTGERDFNRAQTKAYFRRYLEAGFQHVTYLEIPGASHYSRLSPEWLDRALDALDP